MEISNYKKISNCLIITTLTLIVGVFAVTNVHAQSVDVQEINDNPDIQVTARVVGCGDNIAQINLGEQCDGPDLNNQTCQSAGFDSGILTCRSSCILETAACVNNSSNPNNNNNRGGSNGRTRGNPNNLNTSTIAATNVIFTGTADPGSNFFVSTPDGYFISSPVNSNGNFSVTVPEPIPGDYDFEFYALSNQGINGPIRFSTTIQQHATTYIDNIFIPFSNEIEINDLVISDVNTTIAPIDNSLILAPDNSNNLAGAGAGAGIGADLFKEFLDVLSQNENLSPDELRDLIGVFSEQNGYVVDVPGYTKKGLQIGLIPYIKRQWAKLPEVGRKWYPNVYISFLEPYRIFFYEGTNWFRELNNPITSWLFR